jgi:hypothetical protein
VLAFAAGLVLLLGGTGLWFIGQSILRRPILYVDAGSAVVERAYGKVTVARNGLRLKPSDRIVTAPGANVSIRFPREMVTVGLLGQTGVNILGLSPKPQLLVSQGQIEVHSPPPQTHAVMTVSTPHAEISLAQGHSLVTARQSSTWLAMVEGKAEVIRPGEAEKITVHAGQFIVAARGLELAAQPDGQRWQSPYFALAVH